MIWSEECILVTPYYSDTKSKFEIIDTKFYVPIVTLLAEDNEELFQQLKAGFKRTINDTHRENLCFTKVLVSSVHGMAVCLLLIFLICLHNQLSSIHSTITY